MLKINATYLNFSIIELIESEALFFKEIMERELVPYSKIFFELKSYKKLGYKSLDNLPVKSSVSGFLTKSNESSHIPCLKLFRNDKMVFKCALNRLEHKYHKSLFKEHDLISSYLAVNEFKFRKRKGYNYFLLKKEQFGVFTFPLNDEINLNQLLFKHILHHINLKGCYQKSIQLLEVYFDDSKLLFNLKDKNSDKISIWTI